VELKEENILPGLITKAVLPVGHQKLEGVNLSINSNRTGPVTVVRGQVRHKEESAGGRGGHFFSKNPLRTAPGTL